MKIIGIIGSRRRNEPEDFLLVQEAFCQIFQEGDKICSGMCPKGGDAFAVLLSDIWDIDPIWHWPEWSKYGKSAGFKRNTYIAADSDILIACVAKDRKGGTENTISQFVKKFKKTKIIII